MAEVAEVWKKALPEVRNNVNGRGVITALNTCTPLVIEDGVFYIGMAYNMTELAGHLKMPHIKRLIDQVVSRVAGETVQTRIIEGTTLDDVVTAKRKEAEARRLQEQQMAKMRAELTARSSWDSVYEQLSRRYAAVTQKSLPQNRARFFEEALEIIAEARRSQESWDDMGERNFARCIERLAQYSEVPSTIVAAQVLQRAGEL